MFTCICYNINFVYKILKRKRDYLFGSWTIQLQSCDFVQSLYNSAGDEGHLSVRHLVWDSLAYAKILQTFSLTSNISNKDHAYIINPVNAIMYIIQHV